MKNMNLPVTLDSGKSWTEEIPGGIQSETQSYGFDFGSIVLNIKIAGTAANLRAAIAYIVGYSSTLSTFTNQAFDPANGAVQGPYKLSRIPPAKHPLMPNFVATKIQSIVGKGTNRYAGRGGKIDSTNDPQLVAGTIGLYEYYYLSILFEIPRYTIMNDTDLAGRPEYVRYTEWSFEETLETLARKGETWYYTDSRLYTNPTTGGAGNPLVLSHFFAGDRFLRQPKGTLKIKTYDIAQDYVMLGRMIHTNSLMRLGTVNARPFPNTAYRDQNSGAGSTTPQFAQFGPGTLLLLPAKITPHAQVHPVVLQSGEFGPDWFPRTMDVEYTMLYFDPESIDSTTLTLPSTLVNPSVTIPIRGHNLVPLLVPIQMGSPPGGPGGPFYTWFCASRLTPIVSGVAGMFSIPFPTSGQHLLYRYSDFEKLWTSVESLGNYDSVF